MIKNSDFRFIRFDDSIKKSTINFLLDDAESVPTYPGYVGVEAKEDSNVRKVSVQSLGEFDTLSMLLYAYGERANSKCWNYDIVGSMNCEILTYGPEGDKYETHMDSLQINEVYCRKLTVIAFLNDDYEGGKFYFAHSFHSRDYIDVTPGTVIVFPSFVPHGVEPVTSGKRISCATWLIGPNFK